MNLQVEQQQQVLTRKQEQASVARGLLAQLSASPDDAISPTKVEQLILRQNQALYLARILQVRLKPALSLSISLL